MPPEDLTTATPPGPMPEPSSTTWDPEVGHPLRGLVLTIMCLCLVMIVAAVSSLNVAIPTIVRELDPSSTEQLWIIDAYALVFAGLLLLAGALGDRYGRKWALLLGLGIFGAASSVAAYATDPAQLIAFRAVMGIGAALVMPATLSTLTVVYAPRDQAKAIATWAGFAGAGGALGPLASGLLLEHYWWGSVFFVAVPLAVLALLAVAIVVPNSADEDRHRLDYLGALLSVIGLVSLVFGIIEGQELGWTDPVTLGAFTAFVVATALYIRWETSVEHPLLDPRYFLIRRFGLGSMTVTFSFLAMFGMFYLLTLYLQFVLGYTPLSAAVHLLPIAVVMIIVSPQSPRLTARFGARMVVAAGLVIQSVGFLLATLLEPDSGYTMLVLAVVPLALGMALIMPPTTNAIVTSLPQSKAGVASAVNDTTREVGGAIGIALLGTLTTIGYQDRMAEAVEGLAPPLAELARDSIGGAVVAAGQLGDPEIAGPLVAASQRAYVDGLQLSFLVAALVGIVMALIIARFYPRSDDPVDSIAAGAATGPADRTELVGPAA